MSDPTATVPVMVYNPWRALRHLGERVHLIWEPLEPGILAETDGEGVIWMDPDQYQVQRRCTLAHELAHIELGHTAGCTGPDERAATHLAARWLIDMDRLLDAISWTEELEEAAEVLWVDMPTLEARLLGLTSAERQRIIDLAARLDKSA